jgi:hypothetical protein
MFGANWLLLQVTQRTNCHNAERNKYIQHEIVLSWRENEPFNLGGIIPPRFN